MSDMRKNIAMPNAAPSNMNRFNAQSVRVRTRMMYAIKTATRTMPIFSRGGIGLTRLKISDGWREGARLRVSGCSYHVLGIGTASRSLHRLVRPGKLRSQFFPSTHADVKMPGVAVHDVDKKQTGRYADPRRH